MTVDPNSPQILRSVPTDVEAATIVGALAARGVEASTTGGFTAGFRAESPGDVNVVVRHCDLEQAQRLLVEIDNEGEQIDWSTVDVGEPEDPEETKP